MQNQTSFISFQETVGLAINHGVDLRIWTTSEQVNTSGTSGALPQTITSHSLVFKNPSASMATIYLSVKRCMSKYPPGQLRNMI
jgi:hypothetical protein